jgi:hypothetical protein
MICDRAKHASKPFRATIDHGDAQLSFRRKVVVDAGLADTRRVGDVLITERAITARLNECLTNIKNFFAVSERAEGDLAGISPNLLAADVLVLPSIRRHYSFSSPE